MGRARYGSGHVYEKHGSWYGRWRVDGRNVNRRLGRVRPPGSREGLTKRMAERELRSVIDDPEPAARGTTVKDLGGDLVTRLVSKGNKRSAIEAVESHVRIHLVPFFDDTPIEDIEPGDLERLMAKLRRAGLAPKTVKNVLGTMHSIFDLAQRRRILRENPAKLVDKPKTAANDDIRYLTLAELAALMRAVPDDEWGVLERPLYLMAAMTGARQGELLAIRWRDLDWLASKARIRQNYVRGEFDTPKSRRSSRGVPLADDLAGELERVFKASSYQGDDDLVFGHPHTGLPLDRSKVLKRFKAACLRAGVGRTRKDGKGRTVSSMRFHDLRHTFGTSMAAQGTPLKTLQEWFGHRDSKTTDIYADYLPGADEAAQVQSAFAGLVGHGGPDA